MMDFYFAIFNFLSFYGFLVAGVIGIVGGAYGHCLWLRGVREASRTRMTNEEFQGASETEVRRLQKMGWS